MADGGGPKLSGPQTCEEMTMTHWHAFAYDGARTPADVDAKNPQQPVRPLTLSMWFRKPRQMHKGTYSDADSAFEWLERELKEGHPDPDTLPFTLAHCRTHLDIGQDAYAGAYTRGGSGIYVRCLLTCPRTGADATPVRCPEAPLARV